MINPMVKKFFGPGASDEFLIMDIVDDIFDGGRDIKLIDTATGWDKNFCS
jgi:hypothetical protein